MRRFRQRVLLGSPLIHKFARRLPMPVKQIVASWTGMVDVHRYQDFRNPTTKAALVADFLRRSVPNHPQSVLDVGCNAGEVTRHLNEQGFLTLGIDRPEVIARVRHDNNRAALLPFEVDTESVLHLPSFDCVLILSVHHQWIAVNGDSATRRLVRLLSRKAGKTLVMEFSCLNSKYGWLKPELFDDNAPNSVMEYATEWLAETLPDFSFEFLGLNEEHPVDEPYRILFGGSRIDNLDSDRFLHQSS